MIILKKIIKSNNITEINDDFIYKKFDIKLKEIVYMNQENNSIRSSTILKDGRFAVGYSHGSIIIYNNKKYVIILLLHYPFLILIPLNFSQLLKDDFQIYFFLPLFYYYY